MASPADPTSRQGGSSNEKEKQLLQSGVPHTLSGQAPVSARSEEEFTKIKIRLREMSRGRVKRGREGDEESDGDAEAAGVDQDIGHGKRKWRKAVEEDGADSVTNEGEKKELNGNGNLDGDGMAEGDEREKPSGVRYRF